MTQVPGDVTPCGLVKLANVSKGLQRLHSQVKQTKNSPSLFDPEDEGMTIFRNDGNY
jgi:hypothetical protein